MSERAPQPGKPEQPHSIIHPSCRPDAIGTYVGLILITAGVTGLLAFDESAWLTISGTAIVTGVPVTWRFRRPLGSLLRNETGDDFRRL